jgi:hypothetical protein
MPMTRVKWRLFEATPVLVAHEHTAIGSVTDTDKLEDVARKELEKHF